MSRTKIDFELHEVAESASHVKAGEVLLLRPGPAGGTVPQLQCFTQAGVLLGSVPRATCARVLGPDVRVTARSVRRDAQTGAAQGVLVRVETAAAGPSQGSGKRGMVDVQGTCSW